MQHSIVSDFLVHRAGRHLPELGTPSATMIETAQELCKVYGGRLPSPPTTGSLAPIQTVRITVLELFAKEFETDIDDFLQRSQDQDASLAFRTGTSWDKLQGEAIKAWAAYSNHKSRKRNWRRPFEVLDNAAEKVMTSCAIEFLLELVPKGEYSSLLSGGLTLAYNHRENILELFDSLSEQAEQTKVNLQLYSHDKTLHAKSEELYMAVIDCVRHSTAWLDKASACEPFFQQSKYGSKWEDAKANLDNKVKEFEETVNMCMRREIHEIHEQAWKQAEGLERLINPVVATYFLCAGFVKDFPSLLASLLQAQQTHESRVTYTTNVIYTYQPAPAAPPPMAISAWDIGRSCLAIDYHARYPSPAQPFTQDPVYPAIGDLSSDMITATRHIPPYLEREKTGYLALTPRFTAWLRSPDCQFLILHENSPPSNSCLSTLSHLCAMISSTLRANDQSQAPISSLSTIPFFCGLHTSASSTFQGGLGLIRAITLQLLSTLPDTTVLSLPPSPNIPDLATLYSLLLSSHTDNELVSEAVHTTCLIFSLLLSNIPAGMIFILIDGAHWSGTQARKDDMAAVIQHLYQLVVELGRVKRGLVLKVLVTNPAPRQRREWDIPSVMEHVAVESDIGLETDLYMERVVVAGGFEDLVGDAVRNGVLGC
ncbi:hypothetical protein QBC37DRAFT_471368 [Rhypophila decipiens]|uniref:Uncharacterized protein n=1 Tax=Rhypophila decipiens TaxID=261697 RepID=A0AAN6YHY2_9PEZI|nr:hypothetical protein QBC37DRAFT_471368 [Rhypophila decipiens]